MKVLKGKRLLVVVIGLTGVVAGVGWWVSHRPATTHQQSAQATYYCPMHPTYTSDRPGDCPICNMRLVKREPEAASPQPTAAQAMRSALSPTPGRWTRTASLRLLA